jgi:hypothetical protein
VRGKFRFGHFFDDRVYVRLANLLPVIAPTPAIGLQSRKTGDAAVTETPHPSISALHKQWAKLENEQHELAIAIDRVKMEGGEWDPMRAQQGRLLFEISGLVAAIQNAPATTIEDFIALLDVALDHELDLAGDIAFYGPSDYPMTARLLRALARKVPGFEFNSLRRWLSSPGQFEQLMGNPTLFEPEGNDERIEPVGFGEL